MNSPDLWTVLLLTGGTGRRLGGVDKATVDLGATTPLQRVLETLPADVPVIVVGDAIATDRAVTFLREDPPGGGPAAAIAAGLAAVDTDLVGILAVDMPWAVPIITSAVTALDRDSAAEAVVPVGPDGRRQPLCSAWRTGALRRTIALLGSMDGRPVRDLLGRVHVRDVSVTAPEDLADIDTPEDLAHARERARREADLP